MTYKYALMGIFLGCWNMGYHLYKDGYRDGCKKSKTCSEKNELLPISYKKRYK